MEKFDVFSVRDLRNRSGDLLRQAEAGIPAVDYPPGELKEDLDAAL
ncbi:MAG: hypothetical protein L0H73_14495 [Nitrococcus sp.]|nr:hypothetical protein [Nitrococcus sp.]